MSCGAEVAAADLPAPINATADIGLSPDFVGRRREIAELTAALDDALAGRGWLVMLAGEPGIGKTLTAKEFADTASYETVESSVYAPWAQRPP